MPYTTSGKKMGKAPKAKAKKGKSFKSLIKGR